MVDRCLRDGLAISGEYSQTIPVPLNMQPIGIIVKEFAKDGYSGEKISYRCLVIAGEYYKFHQWRFEQDRPDNLQFVLDVAMALSYPSIKGD